MHGWTPLTIVNGAPVDKVILADTTVHLTGVSVNAGGSPATVTAGPGATLDAITTKYHRKGKTVEITGLDPSSAERHERLTGSLPSH